MTRVKHAGCDGIKKRRLISRNCRSGNKWTGIFLLMYCSTQGNTHVQKKEAIKKKEMDLQHLSDFIKAMNYEQNPMNDYMVCSRGCMDGT